MAHPGDLHCGGKPKNQRKNPPWPRVHILARAHMAVFTLPCQSVLPLERPPPGPSVQTGPLGPGWGDS